MYKFSHKLLLFSSISLLLMVFFYLVVFAQTFLPETGFTMADQSMLVFLVLVFAALLTGVCFTATATLQRQQAKLEKALEAKNRFIRMLNHQLSTPLSIMQNAYAMMQEGSLEPKKGLSYLAIGLKRMVQATYDLRSFLQPEKELALAIKKHNIAALVEQAAADHQQALGALGGKVTFSVEKPEFTVPEVLCDIKQIEIVIANLFDNAVAYTEQGSVTVRYRLLANHYLGVSVHDTGIGFSKQDAAHIGHDCFRTQKAKQLRPEGSGLGLSICRYLMENNNGKLYYESGGEGKGSTFGFALPIAK